MAEEKKAEEKKAEKKTDDREYVFVPYIEGEDPFLTVGINGVFTKIRKGRRVKVPRNVAEVIWQREEASADALRQQEEFQKQSVTEL